MSKFKVGDYVFYNEPDIYSLMFNSLYGPNNKNVKQLEKNRVYIIEGFTSRNNFIFISNHNGAFLADSFIKAINLTKLEKLIYNLPEAQSD